MTVKAGRKSIARLNQRLFQSQSENQDHADGRIASVYVTQEMMRRLGATKDLIDGYVNYPRSIAGVDVAFLLS